MGKERRNDCFTCWMLPSLYFGYRQLYQGIAIVHAYVKFIFTCFPVDSQTSFSPNKHPPSAPWQMEFALKKLMPICTCQIYPDACIMVVWQDSMKILYKQMLSSPPSSLLVLLMIVIPYLIWNHYHFIVDILFYEQITNTMVILPFLKMTKYIIINYINTSSYLGFAQLFLGG